MSDIKCPYCGADQDIDHDDGVGYREDEVNQQQCSSCDKYFVFTTSISYYYEVEKADCLNDGEHDWKLTHTHQKQYSKMRCSMCDDERQPTPEERKEYKLDEEN